MTRNQKRRKLQREVYLPAFFSCDYSEIKEEEKERFRHYRTKEFFNHLCALSTKFAKRFTFYAFLPEFVLFIFLGKKFTFPWQWQWVVQLIFVLSNDTNAINIWFTTTFQRKEK